MANAATLKPGKPSPTAPADAAAGEPRHAFAMLSHRGRVRHANEDACAAAAELSAFVVCDGMGGAAAGEIASHLASEAFLQALAVNPASASHPQNRLIEAVRAANQAVFRYSRKSQSLHGMGTTLVAALLDDASPARTIWIAHIGDSRCYRLRDGKLKLLTLDHSLVEEQVRAGVLSRDQASASPLRNIITRAIGSQPTVEPDIAAHDLLPGDLYLLASDGLTRELDDEEMARLLTGASARTLEAFCRQLIEAANASGGHDNITAILVSPL